MTRKALKTLISGAALGLALPGLAQDASAQALGQTELIQTELDGSNAGYYRVYENSVRPRKTDQVGAGLEHTATDCGDPAADGSRTCLVCGIGSYAEAFDGSTREIRAVGPNFQAPNPAQLNQGGNRDRLQGGCLAVRITPTGVETGKLHYMAPTLSGGDRNRDDMKKAVKAVPGRSDLFMVMGNYAPNNHAYRYVYMVQTIDSENGIRPLLLSQPKVVEQKNNDNCSDVDSIQPLVRVEGPGSIVGFESGGCNGNGQDEAWLYSWRCTENGSEWSCTNQLDDINAGLIDEDIERARTAHYFIDDAGNYLMTVVTQGDNQEPRDGISCAVYDVSNPQNLQQLSVQLIADRSRNNEQGQRVTNTMAHVAQLSKDTFAVSYQTRTGRRRNGNKQPAEFRVGLLRVTPETGCNWMEAPKPAFTGGDATHHFNVPIMWGETGTEKPGMLLASVSINGGSAAQGRILTVENDKLVEQRTISLKGHADGALICNYYGNNPGEQGKCTTGGVTIANPGYGVSGGFLPKAKMISIIPMSTRRTTTEGTLTPKLGLDLAFVPVVSDAPPLPEEPLPPTDPENPPPDDRPEPPPSSEPPPSDVPGDSAGNAAAGGCSVASNGSAGGFALLLGLGLLVVTRRRKAR